MYKIINLTAKVQYLFFKSGKERFLAGHASLLDIRDYEITPVIRKMEKRKIISLEIEKNVKRSSKQKEKTPKPSSYDSPKKNEIDKNKATSPVESVPGSKNGKPLPASSTKSEDEKGTNDKPKAGQANKGKQ